MSQVPLILEKIHIQEEFVSERIEKCHTEWRSILEVKEL